MLARVLMVLTMEQSMSDKSEKRSTMPAAERARGMLIDLAGPRGWADNKKALIARAARRAQITYRRAKSIIYAEQRLKLGADEYFQIEELWRAATESVAAAGGLARAARAVEASRHALQDRADLLRNGADQIERAKALGVERRPAADAAAAREEG